MVNVQQKLERIRFRVAKKSHMAIDQNKCAACISRPCLFACPAGLFTLSGHSIIHSYEGCLECGTCYIACEQKAIQWHYPGGGAGVSYRQA